MENQEPKDPIQEWRISQEKLRDPRRFFKKEGGVLSKDYKRKRVSYWDLTPQDMAKINVPVRQVVGVPAFGHGSSSGTGGSSGNSGGGRQTKRIYVGSIPNTVTEEDLRRFFNAKMITRGLVDSTEGDAVLSCKINYAKSFCFLDFRSEGEATKCLQLNGLKLQNCILRIRRPTDYMASVRESRTLESKKKMTPEERSLAEVLNLSMRVESAIANLNEFYPLSVEPTRILVLLNTVKIEDFVKDSDYIELAKDIRKEMEKFGTVRQIVIPRPHRDNFTSGFGKIFVEYDSPEIAKKAKDGMTGRSFEGRTVITTFHSEKDFLEKRY